MLAALGFLVGENFHPLFGGDIDVPAYLAFQQTPLQTFWPAVVLAIAIPEIYSVFTFETPALFTGPLDEKSGNPWEIRSDHEAGDLGFDPLGLKPTDPAELKEMQTKELNNGRLAMIAAAGMILQEVASGEKLFTLAVGGQETAAAKFDGVEFAKSLPGVTDPVGFFDPLGFCSDEYVTEGKIRFYREVELKHGRAGGTWLPCWRELPPAFRWRHRRAGVLGVPADSVADVLAGGGVGDRDSGDLLGVHVRDTGSVHRSAGHEGRESVGDSHRPRGG